MTKDQTYGNKTLNLIFLFDENLNPEYEVALVNDNFSNLNRHFDFLLFSENIR